MMTRSRSLLLGAAATLGFASAASAGTTWLVPFQIEMDSDAGPFAGNIYNGSLSYDDAGLLGAGSETLGLVDNGGSVTEGLLTFTFDFDGDTYHISDDFDHPDYPRIYFEDGELIGVDFIGQYLGDADAEVSMYDDEFIFSFAEGQGQEPQLLAFDFTASIQSIDEPVEQDFYGTITFGDPVTTVVPTPAAASFGLALLGLVITRRGRRT